MLCKFCFIYLQEGASVNTTLKAISVSDVLPVTMVTQKMALSLTASLVPAQMEDPVCNFTMVMSSAPTAKRDMEVSSLNLLPDFHINRI